MRIALVVQGGFDRSGEARVVPALLAFAARLARRHDLHVFALRHYADACQYPLLGATVHDLGGRGASGRGAARLWRALVRELRAAGPFDVLHAYMGAPPGAFAVLAGRRLGVPVVVTLDGGELVALRDIGYGLQCGWRSRLAAAIAIRGAAQVTVCTSYMRRLLGSRRADVREIPLGVDASFFTPDTTRGPGPPWRLVQVASLNAVKDQTMLLHAFAAVRRRVDARLDLVGEDTLGGTLPALATALGVADAVTFHGFQPTSAVREILRSAHVMVQSSRHDAAGVSVLEAAACGVPTVGTAVGYVADGAPERAVAVPVGDAAALAQAIAALLDDALRRERLAAAAREWAERHDVQATAAAFEALYAERRG
jgi:glycosyltransferase involved in cell wall biosynthesis